MVISAVAKPQLNVRGSISRGHLSEVAELRPEPAFMTSTATFGSMPDLAASTTASQLAAMLQAESTLLASFMVWPMPGFSPMTKTLPNTASASLTSAISAEGPDTITASVPFSAPATPPETGASICTMFFFASVAATSMATREPVVERSMKRLTRLP